MVADLERATMANSIFDLLGEGCSVKLIDLSNFDSVLSDAGVAGQFRKLEDARRSWAHDLVPTNSLADQIRKVVKPAGIAIQMAAQLHNEERERFANIKKMLEPLQSIRAGFQMDWSITRKFDDVVKPTLFSDELLRMANNVKLFSAALGAAQSSVPSALLHAQRTFAEKSITDSFAQAMKTYEKAQMQWVVPTELLDSLGALKAISEQVGRLTLPVLDWASAATLAKVLGSRGIESQLAALDMHADGTLTDDPSHQHRIGTDNGLSRQPRDLTTLLNLILALLIVIFQENSSGEWQQQTDKKLEIQNVMLVAQAKRFEVLSILVEKALVQEAKRAGELFVVLERVAVVRSEPRHGTTVVGKLLPREVVKPTAEQGKWIQFEYYHWLAEEYQTGWALKKQFKRVPETYKEE